MKLATLKCGDAAQVLGEYPDDYFHCCVTSPPYWNQRDNAADGQIGYQCTVQEYIDQLVNVFLEVKRVLRPDGTLWLNMGDKVLYGRQLGLPWRVANALSDAGFCLTADIIWWKPNAMPSRGKTAPGPAHEYIFMFGGNCRFYDWFRLAEEYNPGDGVQLDPPLGRFLKSIRSVWKMPVARSKSSHFSVYPEELVKRCILLSTPPQVCPLCDNPLVRDIKRHRVPTRPGKESKVHGAGGDQITGNRDPARHCTAYEFLGWSRTCVCPRVDLLPAKVLDPFVGSGTTSVVATALGRRSVGIDLNQSYLDITARRLEGLGA